MERWGQPLTFAIVRGGILGFAVLAGGLLIFLCERTSHEAVPFLGHRPEPCSVLTLILWKFTLQLAPALEGMKRSPCLLGEDTGELAGVRVLRISETWEGFGI